MKKIINPWKGLEAAVTICFNGMEYIQMVDCVSPT